jgi:hydroxymethylpyrimidine/phosphomethylpyrimidine kinase
MRIALTIAGSDSGAGAGIQADLKTFAAHGVYGTCAITAVTAQNTLGVTAADVLRPDLVRAQIAAVASDLAPHAAKTGMLASAAVVETVAEAVAELGIPFLVVDPVMIAKSGASLLDESALNALRNRLLPVAHVVTPNIPEAEALTGLTIRTDHDRQEAARRLVDLLFDGQDFAEFRHERIPGRHTHGTGCTFAAAIAAHLAQGRRLEEAVPLAQYYVAGAIRHAPDLGRGHGPMDHFWMR